MSFANCLPDDSFQGTINDIAISWGPGAIDRLAADAVQMNVDKISLKKMTEHLAIASAVRLEKRTIRIKGSFHLFTTNTATGVSQPDGCHCTLTLAPGQFKVHIYIKYERGSLATVQVIGESVVRPKQGGPDSTLSIGTYPSY